MTQREFFTAIAENTAVAQEYRDFATERIAALDKRNAQRSSKPSKSVQVNMTVKSDILNILADGQVHVASEVATTLGISTNRASGLLVDMRKAGTIKGTEVKVKGKGIVKGYALPEDTVEDIPEDTAED